MAARRRRPRTLRAEPRTRLAGHARVFWSGRSQAVRLPREFRFDTDEVSIRREGESLVLEPVRVERDARGWPVAWWELAGSAPGFDVGPRDERHERDDVLDRRR